LTGSEKLILTRKGPPTVKLPALRVGEGGIESVNIEEAASKKYAGSRKKQQSSSFLEGIVVIINFTLKLKNEEILI